MHVHVRFRNTFVFKIFGMATKIDSALDFEFFRRSDSNKVHHVFNCNICNRSFVTRVTIACPRSTVNPSFIGQKLMIPGIVTVFESKFISVIGISPFDFFWQKNRLQPARGEPCLKSLV